MLKQASTASLLKALMGMSLALFATLYSIVATARPGMGAMLVVATGHVGPGGLVIDYASLLKRKPKAVPLDWDATSQQLRIHSRTERSIPLAAWEMRELLHAAAVTSGRLEVSVDRVGSEQYFHASPELKVHGDPTPLGSWLQQADLQFADVVMGPGSIDALLGEDVSPKKIELDLLENDSKYGRLTRDLVVPPSSWPTIYFEINDLNAAEPKWRPDYQLRYYTPSLDVVSPEGTGKFIEPWMVTEANRPYQALTKFVESKDDSLRRSLVEMYPALGAAVRFATVLPLIHVFCGANPEQCVAWDRDASAGATATPDPPQVAQEDGASMLVKVSDAWSSARLEAAEAETNDEFRRWIFVDEAIYSLTAGPRYGSSKLFSLLPQQNPYGFGETKTAVALYESALGVLFSDTKALPSSVAAFETSVDHVYNAANVPNREFWKESAALAAVELQRAKTDDAVQHEKLLTLASRLEDCWDTVMGTAKAAAERPESRSVLGWRTELGRAERCHADRLDNGRGLLVEGAFHFAIGWASANAGRLSDARDRLRMLDSITVMARGEPDVRDAVALLESKLENRIAP